MAVMSIFRKLTSDGNYAVLVEKPGQLDNMLSQEERMYAAPFIGYLLNKFSELYAGGSFLRSFLFGGAETRSIDMLAVSDESTDLAGALVRVESGRNRDMLLRLRHGEANFRYRVWDCIAPNTVSSITKSLGLNPEYAYLHTRNYIVTPETHRRLRQINLTVMPRKDFESKDGVITHPGDFRLRDDDLLEYPEN